MAEKVIFPQISGLNWPSHVLQAWMRLHALGIPDKNIRFVPDLGGFSVPEVVEEDVEEDPLFNIEEDPDILSQRHPKGPMFDPRTERVKVYYVDPETVRPRLKVNVRAETVTRMRYDAEGKLIVEDEVVGRLAHFVPPFLAGLPGGEGLRPAEKPLAMLTRQICAAYPQLVATLPHDIREALDATADGIEQALGVNDVTEQMRLLTEAMQRVPPNADSLACRTAWHDLARKLVLNARPDLPDDLKRGMLIRFRNWQEVAFLPEIPTRVPETLRMLAAFQPDEATLQRELCQQFRLLLESENQRDRELIVRELVEIMATEAFAAVAALDFRWGIGWIHGPMSDFRLPAPFDLGGWLLSVTGGLQSHAVLQRLAQQWAESGAFLGVGRATDGETLDMGVFTPEELEELWSLAVWRRETPDPTLLLEQALRRLVHPEAVVRLYRYTEAPGEFGNLLAQPGKTAVMGGAALLQFPRAVILLPLAEDADKNAVAAKAKARILKRLFLPIGFRAEIIWQEALAHLDSPSYLHHEFQQGLRLADTWTALNYTPEEAPDPRILADS